MIMTIGRDALTDAIAPAAKIASKSRTADLACILVDAQESVSFEATDLNESVRCETAGMVEQPGKALLPARLMSDIVRSLPDGAVTIEADDNSATLRCGKSRFEMPSLDAKMFPTFTEAPNECSLKIACSELACVAKCTGSFVSSDGQRPSLTGVCFEWSDGHVKASATDSFHGIELDFDADTQGEASAIVPAGLVQSIASFKSSSDAVLSIGSGKASFSCDGTVMSSRLVDGTFPNLDSFLPRDFQVSASFDCDALKASIERAQAVGAGKMAVAIDVSETEARISVDGGEEGSMVESIECEASGDASFAVFPHLLKNAVKNSSGEELLLGIGSQKNPIMVLSERTRIFVMPKVRR